VCAQVSTADDGNVCVCAQVSTADDGNVCVRVSFRAPTAADLSRAAKADLLASQGGSPLVLPLASPSGCSLS
jgi:hypothetical protein